MLMVKMIWFEIFISNPNFAKSHVEKATICPFLFSRNEDIQYQTMYLLKGNNSFDMYPSLYKTQVHLQIRFHLPGMRLFNRPNINSFTYHKSSSVVSSCEGMVAWILFYYHFPIIVCNPIMGEYLVIDAKSDPIFSAILKSLFNPHVMSC